PGAPGQLFNNNYLAAFPSGLTVGIEDNAGPKHDASWTATAGGRSALKTYLTSAAGGPSTALTADTNDATSTSGGSLPRQTATLALNVGFDIAGPTPVVGGGGFGGLQLCNLAAGSAANGFTLSAAQAAALNGTTVATVLQD